LGSVTLPYYRQLKIEIPRHWKMGVYSLRIGLAENAWPIAGSAVELPVVIDTREHATLALNLSILDEAGGKLQGVIEGDETATISVNIRNESEIPATDLSLSLINLAGSQISLVDLKRQIKWLAPHGTAKTSFQLKAATEILTRDLGIGVSVESQDISKPMRQHFALKGQPTKLEERALNVLGH
jgi:hypothetical protein